MPSDAPIGVFDSGVGGLSVLKAIRAQLPQENLIYVADSHYAPYGGRASDWIAGRSLEISRLLVHQGVKAIVVACNTATTLAIAELRAALPDVPIIAIEPAVKPAVQMSQTKTVAVMATVGTLNSPQYARLLAQYARDADVIACPCPGLADMVEAGGAGGPPLDALLSRCLGDALHKPVDVVVLGCTHYAFVRQAIQDKWGQTVTILDPAPAVAAELQRRLAAADLLSHQSGTGSEVFSTSGDPCAIARVVARLWREDVIVSALTEKIKHG